MSTNNIKRHSAIIATALFALSALSVVFAPAGFGGIWKPGTGLLHEPIIACMRPSVQKGTSADYLVTDANSVQINRGSTATTGTIVHIYSAPLGAVSYDGTVTGSSDVVTAAVAPDAPTGTITVYLQTQDGQITSTTTTITN